jgi:hypothetical protein
MTFWSDGIGEPKRAFRWEISQFSPGGEAVATLKFYAKKVTKPQFTVEEAEHKHLNKSYYFPGHVKWDPVTITFIDDSTGSLLKGLTGALSQSGYDLINSTSPANHDDNATLSKAGLAGNTTNDGKLVVRQLDADGAAVETFTLNNAWIKSIKPSELSYDTEDLSTYDVEIRYDWCTFE